ncbi:hypothetical protein, partial [Roseivivax sp. CAU 1753]
RVPSPATGKMAFETLFFMTAPRLLRKSNFCHAGIHYPKTGWVKDFRCGPWCNGAAWRFVGPRLKSSQGGSRGGQALSMEKVS